MNSFGAVRLGAALVAAVAWAAELLFFRDQVGHGVSVLTALWRTSAFLTDCATVSVALVCTLIAVRGVGSASPFWRTAATMGTILVGALFAGIGGLKVVFAQGPSSVLAHLVVPVLMALLWLALPHGGTRWRHIGGMSLLAVGYLAVMFLRGVSGDGYPYPFVDVPRVGWTAAATFGVVAVAVASVISLVLVSIDRAFSRRYPSDYGPIRE